MPLRVADPPPPLPKFEPINVTLTFSRSTIANDKAWIDFDLHFTYPALMSNRSASVAWETRLSFPQIHFKNDASVDNVPLAAHELLLPSGPLGNLAAIPKINEDPPINDVFQLMNPQYSALFKTSGADGINRVSGLALSSTDEIGQRKDIRYLRVHTTSALMCLTYLPIHLVTVPPRGTSLFSPDRFSTRVIPPEKRPNSPVAGDANGFAAR